MREEVGNPPVPPTATVALVANRKAIFIFMFKQIRRKNALVIPKIYMKQQLGTNVQYVNRLPTQEWVGYFLSPGRAFLSS